MIYEAKEGILQIANIITNDTGVTSENHSYSVNNVEYVNGAKEIDDGLFGWMNNKKGKQVNIHKRSLSNSLDIDLEYEADNYLNIETDLTIEEDILGWWYNKRSVFPLLSAIARQILVIPASSGIIKKYFLILID